MDLYKIDVTGDDILSKGYGILVLFNDGKKEHAFGYRLSSELQTEIYNLWKQESYGVVIHLKPWIYTTIIYLIMKEISRVCYPSSSNFYMHFCNDFDGHQNHITERLKHLSSDLFEDITTDDYVFKKHPKKSKIQKFALELHEGNWNNINKVVIDRNELHNLLAKKKHKKRRW